MSFSFDRVPGWFTGEALCENLIQKISSVKVLKENAAENLPGALRALRKEFLSRNWIEEATFENESIYFRYYLRKKK